MSICYAENESGLQILIPNAAGLQIRQSGVNAQTPDFVQEKAGQM